MQVLYVHKINGHCTSMYNEEKEKTKGKVKVGSTDGERSEDRKGGGKGGREGGILHKGVPKKAAGIVLYRTIPL